MQKEVRELGGGVEELCEGAEEAVGKGGWTRGRLELCIMLIGEGAGAEAEGREGGWDIDAIFLSIRARVAFARVI
jgi:hypothetical protein